MGVFRRLFILVQRHIHEIALENPENANKKVKQKKKKRPKNLVST